MICMACTLDHIYIYIHIYFIYTYILSCISVYLTYLSQFHSFSLISLSHLRSQILVLQSRFQLIHWSAGLEDVQFSAKKNFGSMEIRWVWCFFFSMQDDISPRKFMENEACQVGCHNFRGVPFFQLVRLDCIHFWHALLPTDRVKNVVLVTFESWRSLLSHCITFYSEALQLDGYTLQHVFTILHIPCLWTSSSNCINPPAQNNRTI